MEWLESPKLQGIAALVTIAQIALLAAQTLQRDTGTPRQAAAITADVPPRPARRVTTALAGSLLALVLAWLLYSLPWAGMALALGMPAAMVVSPVFFALGAFTALGALLVRWPTLGGFLGGALPLGLLALYFASINAQFREIAPTAAWFGVFAIFGGMLGLLSGPTSLRLTQWLGLPLPWH